MKSQHLKKLKIPDKPGVYSFKKGEKVLYIGKATSLRSRIKSYFGKDLIVTRGPMVVDMITLSTGVKWKETESVLEALILEANLIKKYQPKYNTKEKDNKSFNYVCITKDLLPKVLIVRGRGLNKKNYNKIYGPFPNGQQLREGMKIIRRIFPYLDNDSLKKNNVEFYRQLGLIPSYNFFGDGRKKSSFPSGSGPSSFLVRGPEEKKLSSNRQNEYKRNIKNLKLFFEGKKKSIITNFKKEMLSYAKKKEFEKAGEIKKRIFALNHINDAVLIKEEITQENAFRKLQGPGGREPVPDRFQKHFPTPFLRIEAYDIAHMGGKNMVGVMTVIENGEVKKSEYRKFIIKTQNGANDTGALEEVLSRRLRHIEWGLPGIIVVDGGVAQVNVAKRVASRYQLKIPIVGVVKDERHKPKAIIGDENIIKKYKKQILLANNEAHRFAITFHKQKRNKSFLK